MRRLDPTDGNGRMDWIHALSESSGARPNWLGRSAMSIWDTAVEAAPWLLLGLIAAAIVKAWVPKGVVVRQLGGRGVGGVVRAAIVGIPLPLCSCGVLPTALGLRRQGASRPATASFLVSTPEVGLDSIALSYVLLGPVLAIARPIAALLSALAAGLAAVGVERWADTRPGAFPAAGGGEPVGPCCDDASTPDAEAEADRGGEGGTADSAGGCCGGGADVVASSTRSTGPLAKLSDGLVYVFSQLLDDIKWWLAIAVVVAGVLMGIFDEPASALQALTTGAWAPVGMAAMVVIGVPLYVCATGSTPLAAGLLVAGVSPGTVLVLLLAGPATNLGAVAILRKELGTWIVGAYLLAISVTAIAAGLALDAMTGWFGWNIVAQASEAAGLFPRWLGAASAFVLIGLAIPPLRRLIGKAVHRPPRAEARSRHPGLG